jgi:hypothetical protein
MLSMSADCNDERPYQRDAGCEPISVTTCLCIRRSRRRQEKGGSFSKEALRIGSVKLTIAPVGDHESLIRRSGTADFARVPE